MVGDLSGKPSDANPVICELRLSLALTRAGVARILNRSPIDAPAVSCTDKSGRRLRNLTMRRVDYRGYHRWVFAPKKNVSRDKLFSISLSSSLSASETNGFPNPCNIHG